LRYSCVDQELSKGFWESELTMNLRIYQQVLKERTEAVGASDRDVTERMATTIYFKLNQKLEEKWRGPD
jgi:hypothetical protein